MTRLIASALGLLLVMSLLVVPAQGADHSFRFPPEMSVGKISGPGHEQLTRALEQRVSGQGGGQTVLSGEVTLSRGGGGERETVPLTGPTGEASEEVYQADPFTAKLWRTEVVPQETGLNDFDLERFVGSMTFDWRLQSAGGETLKEGRAVLNLDRTRGGYLATQGVTKSLGAQESGAKFEARLADEVVRVLTLDLGRQVSASELETGDDGLSRKAKSLASAGDWEGARQLWLELLELNGEYAPALYNLGLYSEKMNQPEAALGYYKSAFVSDGSQRHRDTLTRLTETMTWAGRLPKRSGR